MAITITKEDAEKWNKTEKFPVCAGEPYSEEAMILQDAEGNDVTASTKKDAWKALKSAGYSKYKMKEVDIEEVKFPDPHTNDFHETEMWVGRSEFET